MPAIDHTALKTAMDKAGVTPKQLSVATKLSLGYVCDIRSGRRRLKREPVVRRQIADALGVPVHWIEQRPETAA